MARFKQEEKEYVLRFCVLQKDEEVVTSFEKAFGRKISLYSLRQLRRRLGLFKTGGRGRWKIKGVTPEPGAGLSMWLFATKP